MELDPQEYSETEISKLLSQKAQETMDMPFVDSSLFPAKDYLEPLLKYIWRDFGFITGQSSPVTVGEAYEGLSKISKYTKNVECDGYCVPISCRVGTIFDKYIPYLMYCEAINKKIS